MERVLFISSENRKRSPTAEHVFAYCEEIVCLSAGIRADAENPVTPDLLQWASLIFVMEQAHQLALVQRFPSHIAHAKIICLDIPEIYPYMDWELVQLLKQKVVHYLPHLDLSQLPENYS